MIQQWTDVRKHLFTGRGDEIADAEQELRTVMGAHEKPGTETRGGEDIDWSRTVPGQPLHGKHTPAAEAQDDEYILADPALALNEISELDT